MKRFDRFDNTSVKLTASPYPSSGRAANSVLARHGVASEALRSIPTRGLFAPRQRTAAGAETQPARASERGYA